MVAGGLAGGNQSTAGMMPDPMLSRLAPKGELMNPHEGRYLISCHGSLKGGDSGDCLSSVAVGVSTRDPLALYGEGQILPHGLGGIVSLATCPHDAAGGEVGCHGENHRLSVD